MSDAVLQDIGEVWGVKEQAKNTTAYRGVVICRGGLRGICKFIGLRDVGKNNGPG